MTMVAPVADVIRLIDTLQPDPGRLLKLAASLSGKFRSAKPFPHIAIDGLFPEEVVRDVVAETPPIESQLWRAWGTGATADLECPSPLNRAISEEALMGPLTRSF